ncbi:Asp23/Gls24 family envelope stress response protein [Streptomyces sp. NPDC090077]|uniref:Asp23/Gls24 family envelope stress response protein n=1 Tax=Streptomyces sp. NPDC090077 TaxID=3365938 RepID=UPI00382F0819
MAMNDPVPAGSPAAEDSELLACGRDLAAVWEQAEAWDPAGAAEQGEVAEQGEQGEGMAGGGEPPPDPHSRRCVHCRQALADLRRLRAAALGPEAPRTGGAPDASALARRVMDVVRLELRPGRTLTLGERDEDTWIYESVAARTLRAAAEEVPGVRAGSCRVAPPEGRDAPRRGPVAVRLEVTVEFGPGLRAVTERVREAVGRAAERRLGLALASVDVTVTDLHDPPDRPQETSE